MLRGLNDLATQLRFSPNIGPAMVKDTDDTASADLLIDVLSQAGNRLNANIIVAGDDGIHWNAVRQAARIIKGVGERTPHGQGNFNFGATAMLKPYGPFYPGAWHPGGGPRSFAFGLESANVVMDVFSRERDPRTAGKALTDALALHLRVVEASGDENGRPAADGLTPGSIRRRRPAVSRPLARRSNHSPVPRSVRPGQKRPRASSRVPSRPCQ